MRALILSSFIFLPVLFWRVFNLTLIKQNTFRLYQITNLIMDIEAYISTGHYHCFAFFELLWLLFFINNLFKIKSNDKFIWSLLKLPLRSCIIDPLHDKTWWLFKNSFKGTDSGFELVGKKLLISATNRYLQTQQSFN